ncbi:aspartate kinase [Bacillus carboniphilus]|uniref:Aspartokinase n=1 Tax=Bacillus carboniphilus TaxID=86663 RepID=A0ABY9K087_9BACI|nr:aspartate kinase [Bacillus carboniphilus]WLR44128.1 aspartate kinase [Bacillus carboniphilus]
MGLIVQKYGGTSVGSIEKIEKVADKIIEEKTSGNQVVVVVSAMGDTTDQLLSLVQKITMSPSSRELDMLLSTGEQMSSSLLAMMINERGHRAVSLTGWQAGIMTESFHTNARIMDIDISRINLHLAQDEIVIIAGFQGICVNNNITTLGRGGSDTTAVAVAAALKAKKCDIYTDVMGVFTTDPRIEEKAKKLNRIGYDEMLEMANLGASVLHPRAVEFAKNYQVRLEVRSSMCSERGTVIEEDKRVEQSHIVSGVAFDDNITRVTLIDVPMLSLSSIFTLLADKGVNVDVIIQGAPQQNRMTISFSIKTDDLSQTVKVLKEKKQILNFKDIDIESHLAKVSIVGSGMVSNPGVAAEMFTVLDNEGIEVKMVSTSEIKVSTIISSEEKELAVSALHDALIISKKAVYLK